MPQPTEYLRDVRLDRVHAALRAGDPGTTTVTDVAFRWGFTHLGRFAGDYRRRRFTESPSVTLRRGPRHGVPRLGRIARLGT